MRAALAIVFLGAFPCLVACGSDASGEGQRWQECCCTHGDEVGADAARGVMATPSADAAPEVVDAGRADAHPEASPAEAGGCASPKPSGHRVMPLGDSITNGDGSPGGWRVKYWDLAAGANPGLDFTGSLSNGPASLPDKQHEGHSGKRIDELRSLLGTHQWVKNYEPDLVLVMAGANDLIQKYDLEHAHERMKGLVLEIHQQHPAAWIVVATTTVINEVGAESRAQAFNAKLPAVIGQLAAQCIPVELVDMHPVLTVGDLDAGGVHPTAAGYDKLGKAWFEATKALLGM
jgi:lysophospholipase L1-like esterase